MKKALVAALCLMAAVTGCGNSKSGGGSGSPVNPYYANGYYQNGMGYRPGYPGAGCPGFQNQIPYAPANGGWGYNNGNMYVNGNMNGNMYVNGNVNYNNRYNNGPFQPACNQYQNQYQLNYYSSGACSFLTQSTGKIYQEIVFPGTQQVTCAEMSTIQTAYSYGTPMAVNAYQGAMIGCVPGYYVPTGCTCMGAGVGGGVNFGIWAGGFGVSFGAGVGTGMQAAGICY